MSKCSPAPFKGFWPYMSPCTSPQSIKNNTTTTLQYLRNAIPLVKKKKFKILFQAEIYARVSQAGFISRIISSGLTLGRYSFKSSIALKGLVNLKNNDHLYSLHCCPLLTKGWEPLPDAALSWEKWQVWTREAHWPAGRQAPWTVRKGNGHSSSMALWVSRGNKHIRLKPSKNSMKLYC